MTHWITAESGRFKHAAGLSAFALVAFLVLALSTREWTPIADETQYLNAACSGHHRGLHDTGNEKSWWRQHGIGPMVEAARLWQETHGEGETKSQEPARV